jgi:hypothetical protein
MCGVLRTTINLKNKVLRNGTGGFMINYCASLPLRYSRTEEVVGAGLPASRISRGARSKKELVKFIEEKALEANISKKRKRKKKQSYRTARRISSGPK